MTIIVKPEIVPTAETSDQVIGDWLERLLGTLSYPQFETVKDGNITIMQTKFSMRVGKWLGRPTQAIMAHGQFVKLHTFIDVKHNKENLKLLNPDRPDDCLYDGGWNPGVIADAEEKRKAIEAVLKQKDIYEIEKYERERHEREKYENECAKIFRSPIDGPWPRKTSWEDGW